jgi:hypothetical protein
MPIPKRKTVTDLLTEYLSLYRIKIEQSMRKFLRPLHRHQLERHRETNRVKFRLSKPSGEISHCGSSVIAKRFYCGNKSSIASKAWRQIATPAKYRLASDHL